MNWSQTPPELSQKNYITQKPPENIAIEKTHSLTIRHAPVNTHITQETAVKEGRY